MDSVWNPRDQLTVEKDIKLYRGTKTRHGWMIDEDIQKWTLGDWDGLVSPVLRLRKRQGNLGALIQ